MKVIYAVSAGCYSDYGIKAMFSTKELAQEYIDKAQKIKSSDEDYDVGGLWWADDSPKIEEWVLDGQKDAEVTTSWGCGMLLDDGSVVERPHEHRVFESVTKTSFVSQYNVSVPCYQDRLIVRVVSYKSADHAVKLAAEQRQKWLREVGTRP